MSSVVNLLHMAKGAAKGSNPDTITGGFIEASGDSGITVATPKGPALSDATPDPDLKKVRRNRAKRSLRLACMGLSPKILHEGDPRYRNCIELANRYRRKRVAELSELHGGLSAGASSMLASAALALAASRYLYELYAVDLGGELGTVMLKQAASLADSARQSELAAWEVSAREGLARRKLAASDAGVPWLAHVDEGHKAGRKTNLERRLAQESSIVTEDGTEVYLEAPVPEKD